MTQIQEPIALSARIHGLREILQSMLSEPRRYGLPPFVEGLAWSFIGFAVSLQRNWSFERPNRAYGKVVDDLMKNINPNRNEFNMLCQTAPWSALRGEPRHCHSDLPYAAHDVDLP